ncbi:YwpF family protein [Litchfieldia alkalitelluris]|uniref:YwpF family protein n=1 Tax=Litchfieldia alkalitelluris TaxID=304268 RepID=UPI001476601E|nr:YwpF family protein [Litchfieldia alkalitelluris]
MKTFKLVSLSFLPDVPSEEKIIDVDLIDGLIINREDSGKRWIIEAFLNKSDRALFEQFKNEQKALHLQVTISDKSNDPAFVQATVMSIKEFSDHISILFDGKLERAPFVKSEQILAQLLQQGLQGEELLKTFNQIVHEERKKILSNVK